MISVSLYVESIKALAPWFFSLDHYHYARWIPIHVHIRDMESLPETIQIEFKRNGHWVVHKTAKRFSAMPINQAHEQNNNTVKSAGGAVGLTENPSAFRKWMISGPELSIVQTFNELGNPFLESSSELLALDTRNVLDKSVIETVNKIYEIGKEQFNKYYKEVINDCTHSIHDPIKKNLYLFLAALSQGVKENMLKEFLCLKVISLFSLVCML